MSCWTKPGGFLSPRVFLSLSLSPSSPRRNDRGEGSINRDFPHLERPEVVNGDRDGWIVGGTRALEKTDAAFRGNADRRTAIVSLRVNHPSRKWRHSVKGVAEKVHRESTKFPPLKIIGSQRVIFNLLTGDSLDSQCFAVICTINR